MKPPLDSAPLAHAGSRRRPRGNLSGTISRPVCLGHGMEPWIHWNCSLVEEAGDVHAGTADSGIDTPVRVLPKGLCAAYPTMAEPQEVVFSLHADGSACAASSGCVHTVVIRSAHTRRLRPARCGILRRRVSGEFSTALVPTQPKHRIFGCLTPVVTETRMRRSLS